MAKFSVFQAAKKMGYTPHYVRLLIQRGKLEASKEPISPESKVLRYVIDEEAMEHYLKESSGRSRRTDGRNKYLMYAAPKEFSEAIRILKAAGPHMRKVAEMIVPANQRKPEYGENDER